MDSKIYVCGHPKSGVAYFASGLDAAASLEDYFDEHFGSIGKSFELGGRLLFDDGGAAFAEQDIEEVELNSCVFCFMPHQYNSLIFEIARAQKYNDIYLLSSTMRQLALTVEELLKIKTHIEGNAEDLEQRANDFFDQMEQARKSLFQGEAFASKETC